MESCTFDWSVNEGVGLITLNRRPGNAMNRLFFGAMKELCSGLKSENDLRALVICGSGRHFSSGADLNDLLNGPYESQENMVDFFTSNSHCFYSISQLRIPVVAAVQGVCLGSAAELALACHFRFFASNVLFGFPEVSFGLMPGCGGTVLLPGLVNRSTAMELLLSGRNVTADEALKTGLADRILPRNEVVAAALQFAAGIAHQYSPGQRLKYLNSFHWNSKTEPYA